jgi:glutamyl-tRNA reductase
VRIAEDEREEAYKRASRMEENKQDTAANNLRRRADETFTKSMEKLSPALEKGAEEARKALEEGSEKAKENLDTSGSTAGQSLRAGGQDAANALKQAIDPPGDDRESVLQDIYDFFRNTFFKDFQKRLPQNALS